MADKTPLEYKCGLGARWGWNLRLARCVRCGRVTYPNNLTWLVQLGLVCDPVCP